MNISASFSSPHYFYLLFFIILRDYLPLVIQEWGMRHPFRGMNELMAAGGRRHVREEAEGSAHLCSVHLKRPV